MKIRELQLNFSFLFTLLPLMFANTIPGYSQSIFRDVPAEIDTSKKYLFYLHGKIIEDQGILPTSKKYGVYEYEKILETFANKGFIVISEPRGKNTDVWTYSDKVVKQIQALQEKGVASENITVVGASKGGAIAILVSSKLNQNNINYVIMAICNETVTQTFLAKEIYLKGNVLSIFDEKDELAGTCKDYFEKSEKNGLNQYKEVELKIGIGHGILYTPMKEWIDLVVEWADQ